MFADLLLEGAVTRIEGPLLFARRAARVGLNSAVEVVGNAKRGEHGSTVTFRPDHAIFKDIQG